MTTQNLTDLRLPERPVLITFLLFIVLGGDTSVAISIAYQELTPFWAATTRFALAVPSPGQKKATVLDECKDRSGQVLLRCT